jgi:thiol-disulfide isomerase/thioredoxin
MTDIPASLEGRVPGDAVEIEYERGGTPHKAQIILADRESVLAKQSPLGKAAPDVVGTDIEGREVHLSQLKGQVVLLDFWATWCMPCMEELPLQQLLWERLQAKEPFVWVSVSADTDEAAWKSFVQNNKLGGIQLRDADWSPAFGVQGYPTTFLIDKQGMVRCEVRGSSMAQGVRAMLSEP